MKDIPGALAVSAADTSKTAFPDLSDKGPRIGPGENTRGDPPRQLLRYRGGRAPPWPGGQGDRA